MPTIEELGVQEGRKIRYRRTKPGGAYDTYGNEYADAIVAKMDPLNGRIYVFPADSKNEDSQRIMDLETRGIVGRRSYLDLYGKVIFKQGPGPGQMIVQELDSEDWKRYPAQTPGQRVRDVLRGVSRAILGWP